MSSVIVFGPTGSVGSFVARTAQENGATVFLAMRDTQKAIPGLTAEQEKVNRYKRVQADLTDPDSVAAAIKDSGAKRAFIYRAHTTKDHMRGTLTALKEAGVEFVVFLSSYTIVGEPRDVEPSDLIPFIHAQVEIALDEIFGPENYVALRPGGFATNLLRFKKGINDGAVDLLSSEFKLDCITPGDMGAVGGNILVNGPRNGQRKVYLYGPQILGQAEAIQAIGKVLGKSVTIGSQTEQEALDGFVQAGIPKPVAEYMVKKLGTATAGEGRAHYNEGVQNVQLYTGKPSQSLEEWVGENKALFA
ncbi:hypothetical protein ASPVEDRAFT_38347 [Aspergillus versicolor CBS 583.65]|uniref:NmrA-like domain-containing protein n=1 Tax=Aspergillus versicolor CBS 583.65 TaxID=1036611 RepID=A0A1L9PBM1_ASPVE|nr:uncharacterized protein ASPVEDRAFT_38347 [Aspergillus versicolor CBS 583.65]OJI98863.1 hypothetical protein ASPVEDRAFT_38347 [Aspergillus versicolor CBS 583.65]